MAAAAASIGLKAIQKMLTRLLHLPVINW